MSIITISRGICSGGTELANLISQEIGWRVLSQEEVSAAAAERYHMSEEELVRGLYLPATFYERFTHRKTRYLLATQATICELLADGNGVYHGLAGQFLFRDLRIAFKVRVVAPMRLRIDNTMKRAGMSKTEAARHIHRADEHRLLWGRQIFDADVNNPDLYDLVVNLEQVKLETAATLIADVMRGQRATAVDAAMAEYRDFALETRIRSELYFNSPYTPDLVTVKVLKGEVYLSGGRGFEANRDPMVEFIGRIPGVTTIHTDGEAKDTAEIVLDPGSSWSSRDTTAADIMLDIERYPHCQIDCTIRQAMVALGGSAIKLEDDHFVPPRYLLIHDEAHRLVGVVGRRELLKGLIPHLKEDREATAAIQDLLPFGGEVPREIFIRWTSFFSSAAIEASKASVETVMVPIKGTVKVDDSLSTVVSTMLYSGVDLVAVLDGPRVVGVVMMTNIFDIVSQFVIEHGGSVVRGGGHE